MVQPIGRESLVSEDLDFRPAFDTYSSRKIRNDIRSRELFHCIVGDRERAAALVWRPTDFPSPTQTVPRVKIWRFRDRGTQEVEQRKVPPERLLPYDVKASEDYWPFDTTVCQRTERRLNDG